MKIGDKVRFVKHHEGEEYLNTLSGLVIGETYTVEAVGEDGTPYINGGLSTYEDEYELVCTGDQIVESVINAFRERSERGIAKYGTTLQRDDLKPSDWIKHAQEEAMDFVLYLERLKQEFNNQ